MSDAADSLARMASRRPAPTAAFRCTECGWTTAKWVGRCGECQQWGTVVESATQTGITASVTPLAPTRSARPITQIDTRETPRRTSGVGEFDRVLGGGVRGGGIAPHERVVAPRVLGVPLIRPQRVLLR